MPFCNCGKIAESAEIAEWEAEIFRNLVKAIMENDSKAIPTPMNDLTELEQMYWRFLKCLVKYKIPVEQKNF